jgi:hypothetical protein
VEAASFAPVPIPGGTPALGGAYHVFGPAAFDPVDAEPVTITNLDAVVGLAYVSGMVTQTNTKTGEVVRLPFVDSDMRFMQGVFRGTDGKVHPGAFRLAATDGSSPAPLPGLRVFALAAVLGKPSGPQKPRNPAASPNAHSRRSV